MVFFNGILFILSFGFATATYQDTCKQNIGTVNCNIYCEYCNNKDVTAIFDKQTVPELNCSDSQELAECRCDDVDYCKKVLMQGSWKPAMKKSDMQKGRTIFLIDESASINSGDGDDEDGLLKEFIIANYNKWMKAQKNIPTNAKEYIHDKQSVLMFNTVLELLHTNNRSDSDRNQELDSRCNYYPEGNTAMRDAIGCTVHMFANECNNKLVVFSDGEENASTEFDTEQLVKMVGKQITEKGWKVFYISTLDKDDMELEQVPIINRYLHLIPGFGPENYFSLNRKQKVIIDWLQHYGDESYPSIFSTELWEQQPTGASLIKTDTWYDLQDYVEAHPIKVNKGNQIDTSGYTHINDDLS